MSNFFRLLLLLFFMQASSKAFGNTMFSTYKGSIFEGKLKGAMEAKQREATEYPGFEFRTYSQTLDHFNYGPESSTTFPQRYAINFKYWGGANSTSPIFFFLGDWCNVERHVELFGFLEENAPSFRALLVFAEHRYYGESYPFGSKEVAYTNSSTLKYFSSEQALADYAQLLRDLKANLSAVNSPVIAFGADYSGMLASWFRLKYPHMVIGALASSAPILYFDNITPQNGYCSVTTEDFRETSKSCYEIIKKSWSEIDNVAIQFDGLTSLSKMFNTCMPLHSAKELKNHLETIYFISATCGGVENSYISAICDGVDREPQEKSVLKRLASGIKAFNEDYCLNITRDDEIPKTSRGWDWQTCTEIIFPIGCSSKNSMFEDSPFNLKNYIQYCQKLFGDVVPRPDWVTIEYGGHNIKRVLQKFGSNIIFSNGLRDPFSIGGVLQNISDTIVALTTTKGSDCLDLFESNSKDPDWLVAQRKAEVDIMKRWIEEYRMIPKE